MRRFVSRFISVLLALLLISSLTVSVFASGKDYVSPSTFVTWIAGKSEIAQHILSYLSFDVCSVSADGRHHASSYVWDDIAGYYDCVCEYCGHVFFANEQDLRDAYDNYVSSLPATGITSAGRLFWQPTFADLSPSSGTYASTFFYGSGSVLFASPVSRSFSGGSYALTHTSDYSAHMYVKFSSPSGGKFSAGFSGYVKFPIEGFYYVHDLPSYMGSVLGTDSILHSFSGVGAVSCQNGGHYSPGFCAGSRFLSSNLVEPVENCIYYNFDFTLPTYEILPDSAIDSSADGVYGITTRPTSITGSNYGIVGDNGQIIKVEDNSTIVNETNNTYYNPVTGTTSPITDWSFDYSDRSYKVTLESGDTSTITYGDENISITETTINESGDTITNNYTIYYIVDGTGTETPPCIHEWTETSTTPATCTVPGSRLSTCTKCGQTKTESIPALGHDWQIKQSVTTEYDDTGQLVQEGYTIYECSRCHEQYKSASGASPPTNPADPDASGDGVFSGIFGLLLDFLSFFWKTFRDFTKSGVKAFLEALKDGTSDIFGLLNPFDWSA